MQTRPAQGGQGEGQGSQTTAAVLGGPLAVAYEDDTIIFNIRWWTGVKRRQYCIPEGTQSKSMLIPEEPSSPSPGGERQNIR